MRRRIRRRPVILIASGTKRSWAGGEQTNRKNPERVRRAGQFLKWIKAISILTLLFLLIYFMQINLKPIIQTVSGNQARILCTKTVNEAVMALLARQEAEYSSLVKLVTDSAGNVCAIETNTIEMNQLKARLTDAVNEALGLLPSQNVMIPIGTLTGIEILSGRGPRLKLKMSPSSYVESQIVNNFDSTGINQTRHQILIEFTVTMNAILAPYSTRVEVKTNVLVAETIIIGAVPDMFANF